MCLEIMEHHHQAEHQREDGAGNRRQRQRQKAIALAQSAGTLRPASRPWAGRRVCFQLGLVAKSETRHHHLFFPFFLLLGEHRCGGGQGRGASDCPRRRVAN